MKDIKKDGIKRLSKQCITLLLATFMALTNISYSGLMSVNAEDAITWQEVRQANTGSTRVYFIGTNESRNSLSGAGEIALRVNLPLTVLTPQDGDINPPQQYVDQNGNINRRLRGWYAVPKANQYTEGEKLDQTKITYVKAGDAVTLTEDLKSTEGPILFYADWEVISYDFGSEGDTVLGGLRTDVVRTDSIRTDVYDIDASIYNLLHAHRNANSNDYRDNGSGALFVDYADHKLGGPLWPTTRKEIVNEAGETVNLNAWTGNGGAAAQGIWEYVKDSGFFDDSTQGVTYVGSANNGPMFWLDERDDSRFKGYYVYDSEESAAVYNQSEERFYVYNQPQMIKAQKGNKTAFLPFNAAKDNGESVYDAYKGNVNYHIGMVTQIDFFLTGNVGDPNANKINVDGEEKDMIFYFSGDDDVYVFVDGKLALDIGGIHDRTEGTINFHTGEVKTRKTSNNDTVDVTNNKSIEGLGAGNHKLTIYYMERGADESNNLTAFLLTIPATIKLHKVETQTGETTVFPGAKFYLQNEEGNFYHLAAEADPNDPLSVPKVEYVDSKEDATVLEADEDGMITMRYIQDGKYRLTEIGAPDYYNGLPGSFKFVVENAKILYNSLEFSADTDYTNPDQPFTDSADWADHVKVEDDEVTLEVSNDRITKPLVMKKNFDDGKNPEGVPFKIYEIPKAPLKDDGVTLDEDKLEMTSVPEEALLVYEGKTNSEGYVTDYTWYPRGKDNTPADMIEYGKETPELKGGALYYIVEDYEDANYYTLENPIVLAVDKRGIYLVSDPKDNNFVFEGVSVISKWEEEQGENPAELDVQNISITTEDPIKKVNGNAQIKDKVDEEGNVVYKEGVRDTDGNKVPEKEWDGSTEELAARNEVFTYTITQKLPAKTTKIIITDELVEVLEIVKVSVSPNPNNIFTVNTNGNTVTMTGDDGDVTDGPIYQLAKNNTEVTLTIEAKIRDGVTDATLIEKYGANYDNSNVVPNTAKVQINDKDKVDTNTVVVTPPAEDEEPEKEINGQKDKVTLDNRDDEFTYTVTKAIPADAVKVEIEDKLEDVLQVEEVSFSVSGITPNVSGNTVTVTMNKEQSIANRGKEVTLTIKAKIREDVTDEQLFKLYGNTTNIPNTATVKINDNSKNTNTVEVTPPDNPREDPVKKINGDTKKVELTNRTEQFTYTVTQKITDDAVKVEIEDKLEDVLKIESTSFSVSDITPVVSGNTVTVTMNKEQSIANRGKEVTLTIVATIKEDVTDEQLMKLYGGTTDIPNKATVKINDAPKETNEVEVTPPDTPKEEPKKKVDGEESLKLDSRPQEFTYTITQKVDADAISVSFEDVLEPVLEILETSINVGGVKVNVSGNTVTAELTKDQSIENRGKEVTLTIKAKIKDTVTDEELIKKYGSTTVPNVAKVTINNNGRSTNKVEVTPPDTPKEEPKKEVNGKSDVKLTNRDEVFTYTITQKVDADAVKVVIEDELKDVLEVKSATFSVSGITPEVNGNKVTVTMNEAQSIAARNTEVTLTIEAKIKDDVTDEQLIAKYGSTTVPNEAKVTINDDPRKSNEVKVTPPDNPKDNPEKFINGQKDLVTLVNRADTFVYTVTQKMPEDAVSALFEDELEEVLQVIDASIDVNGVQVEVNGNKVSAELTKDQAMASRGKTITLTITAKIKDTVTDEQLIAKYGSTNVPNKAKVTLNDVPRATNEVLVTPPDSPREDPNKEINGQTDKVELDNRSDTFVYTVNQVVPDNAIKVLLSDTLEDVLEVISAESNVEGVKPTVNGNKVELELGLDESVKARGTKVTLTITAKIKDSVTDKELVKKYGSTTVPNKATVAINDKGLSTNEVEVTPPYTPETEPEKQINGTKDKVELSARNEKFVYTVSQKLPLDAVSATFTDELVEVLEVLEASINVEDVEVEVNGNVVSATLSEEQSIANRDKVVTLTITAKIRDGITDEQLFELYGGTDIPNEGIITINDDPKTTNEVLVSPPDNPGDDPVKSVNDQIDTYELESRPETFTYKVTKQIPYGAVSVEFVDELESVLEVVDASIDVEGVEAEIIGNTVKATFSRDAAIASRGKVVTLTINAKIRDEVTNGDLIRLYGSVTVPNKAKVTINDKELFSNEVEVVPPEEPREDPNKEVNKQTEKYELAARNEVFTYTVNQQVPTDAYTVTFTDTLEDVLEIIGTPTVNIDGAVVEVNGNNVVATISGDAIVDARGALVTLTINAKIRDDVTDKELIERYGTTDVPNTAEVAIDDKGNSTNTVLVTPPEVPHEDPKKDVNGQESLKLEERGQLFTYTISLKVSDDAVTMQFVDVLEDVLVVKGTPKVSVEGAEVIVEGNVVTVNLGKEVVIPARGTTITVTIDASLKAGIRDSELIEKYGSLDIPNTATVKINDDPRNTNTVVVTPPEVPTPKTPDEPTPTPNTPTTPKKPSVDTADQNNSSFWMMIFFMSLISSLGIFVLRGKYNRN